MINGDTNPRVAPATSTSPSRPRSTRPTRVASRSSTVVPTAMSPDAKAVPPRELHASVLGLADRAEDASPLLETWRPGSRDQMVEGLRLRSLPQRGGLPRASHQRTSDRDRRRLCATTPGTSVPPPLTPRPATSTLYHEPQVVYALDPIIEPVKTDAQGGDQPTRRCRSPSRPMSMLSRQTIALAAILQAGRGRVRGQVQWQDRQPAHLRRRALAPGHRDDEARRAAGPHRATQQRSVGAPVRDDRRGVELFQSASTRSSSPRTKAPIGSTPTLVNCPNRGMTGFNWSGTAISIGSMRLL